MKRVAVFIDYRNCFHAARETRFAREAFMRVWYGQFWPHRLAELLVDKGPADERRQLTYVGVYTGRPDPRRDAATSAAHLRQCSAWEAAVAAASVPFALKTRSLRYLPGRPATEADEKGVDVQLAIDAMVMASRDQLDVGIIASTDNDMLPVVEGFLEIPVEVIGWAGRSQKLEIPGRTVPVRWIGQRDYDSVADRTDYNVRSE